MKITLFPPKEPNELRQSSKDWLMAEDQWKGRQEAGNLSVPQSRLWATLHESGCILGDMQSHKVPRSD